MVFLLNVSFVCSGRLEQQLLSVTLVQSVDVPSLFNVAFLLQGDLNGHRGLVPSNFLQALPEDAVAERLTAQSAPEPKRESQVAQHLSVIHSRLQNSRCPH